MPANSSSIFLKIQTFKSNTLRSKSYSSSFLGGATVSMRVEIFNLSCRPPAFVISSVFNWLGVFVIGTTFPFIVVSDTPGLSPGVPCSRAGHGSWKKSSRRRPENVTNKKICSSCSLSHSALPCRKDSSTSVSSSL